MKASFAAFGAALLASTEAFAFLASIDAILFWGENNVLVPVAIGLAALSLAFGGWVFIKVRRIELALEAKDALAASH